MCVYLCVFVFVLYASRLFSMCCSCFSLSLSFSSFVLSFLSHTLSLSLSLSLSPSLSGGPGPKEDGGHPGACEEGGAPFGRVSHAPADERADVCPRGAGEHH